MSFGSAVSGAVVEVTLLTDTGIQSRRAGDFDPSKNNIQVKERLKKQNLLFLCGEEINICTEFANGIS